MTAAIECVRLSKVYDRHIVALKDVSLSILAGASYAPLAGGYTLTTAGFSAQAALALAGAAVYEVGPTALAQVWLARRDLILH